MKLSLLRSSLLARLVFAGVGLCGAGLCGASLHAASHHPAAPQAVAPLAARLLPPAPQARAASTTKHEDAAALLGPVDHIIRTPSYRQDDHDAARGWLEARHGYHRHNIASYQVHVGGELLLDSAGDPLQEVVYDRYEKGPMRMAFSARPGRWADRAKLIEGAEVETRMVDQQGRTYTLFRGYLARSVTRLGRQALTRVYVVGPRRELRPREPREFQDMQRSEMIRLICDELALPFSADADGPADSTLVSRVQAIPSWSFMLEQAHAEGMDLYLSGSEARLRLASPGEDPADGGDALLTRKWTDSSMGDVVQYAAAEAGLQSDVVPSEVRGVIYQTTAPTWMFLHQDAIATGWSVYRKGSVLYHAPGQGMSAPLRSPRVELESVRFPDPIVERVRVRWYEGGTNYQRRYSRNPGLPGATTMLFLNGEIPSSNDLLDPTPDELASVEEVRGALAKARARLAARSSSDGVAALAVELATSDYERTLEYWHAARAGGVDALESIP